MNKAPKISICVITKNESEKIAECLASVSWADEVILVDDFSEDDTVKIASQFHNVKIFQNKFEGFGQQKQFAVTKASNDWIFNIDADEVVTDDLKNEIQQRLSSEEKTYSAYFVRRLNLVFGKNKMDAFPGTIRLFNKKYTYYRGYVHERPIVEGLIGQLNSYLIHKSKAFTNYKAYFKTYVMRYSTFAAKDYYDRGRQITILNVIWYVVCIPFLVFLRDYVRKMKLKDGLDGLFISFCNAMMYALAYLKLIEIQKDKK